MALLHSSKKWPRHRGMALFWDTPDNAPEGVRRRPTRIELLRAPPHADAVAAHLATLSFLGG
jgi:hypothetical protein